ncbi:MAG: ImmA/IrrE family metallo-endopeptidase [Gemmatimonadaceae bacterium]
MLLLATTADPVQEVIERAREVVYRALESGWSGPPFEPMNLAEHLGIAVVPKEDVRDARIVAVGRERFRIEYNPNRPLHRVRYSLAHEIAHTLFPDCADVVRNRGLYHESTSDSWQLEALCNIAAAEILMPAASLADVELAEATVEDLMEVRTRFGVSAEALLIRLTELTEAKCYMFCASSAQVGARYRVDYGISSATWDRGDATGVLLPLKSHVTECSAIGFTSRGQEAWQQVDRLHVECVAIPPYPGTRVPRVVGLALPPGKHATAGKLLSYVTGDATQPRGDQPCLLVHVVNDATPSWGGRGFAMAVRDRWPHLQKDFAEWARVPGNLALGSVHFSQADDRVTVASVVAQKGYGDGKRPRIRYGALRQGLIDIAAEASRTQKSLHMPRIGTGQARGAWDVVVDMIKQTICSRRIPVTVYSLPNAPVMQESQVSLSLFSG